MVEKIFQSSWKQSAWLRRKAAVLPVGGWIVMAVIVCVVGRYLYASGVGMHRREIAAAYAFTGLIYGTPQPNNTGSEITFCQSSANGIGVYLLNTATGQKQLIHEKLATDDPWITLDVWPWSPVGTRFVYAQTNLFLCEASTGDVVAKLPIEGLREGKAAGAWDFNGVKSLVWLSPDSFIYVSKHDHAHWFQKSVAGQWNDAPAVPAIGTANLTALSTNTIAWQSGNRIWSLDLANHVTSLLYDAGKAKTLTRFTYSKKRNEFLLSFSANGVDSLGILTNGSSSSITSQSEISKPVRNVVWVNGVESGSAFLSPVDADHNTMTVKSGLHAEGHILFNQGTVETFTASADGKKLFAVGSVGHEPAPGIWEYDVNSGKLRNLVAYSQQPSKYARRMVALHGSSLGHVEYYLYPPTGLDRHSARKHPLVIGDTLFKRTDPEYQNRTHGPLWAPMLANCGAFVVIVERDKWMDHIDQLGNRIMDVYTQLAKDPLVDTNRVFLFGSSLETRYVSKLAEARPGLWHGMMLLNPSSLPDFSKLPSKQNVAKILISVGGAEHEKARLERYQQAANQAGMLVEYYIHAGSGHWLLGRNAVSERRQDMERFVFDH